MRTLIWLSFITTFLVITVLSVPAALDPALILYFSFDEQIDGRQVEDLTGGGNHGTIYINGETAVWCQNHQRARGGSHRSGGIKNFQQHQCAGPRGPL